MISSIELQVISRILTSEVEDEINTLCSYDISYYSVFRDQIEFILDHRLQYGDVPDVFTFQAQFPDVNLIKVNEPLTYLTRELRKNKQHILLLETFNKLKDLGDGDVHDAWNYLSVQCEKASQLDSSKPLDVVKDAQSRSDQIVAYANQARIPTGFDEIDKLMYGGLSTVEELLLIFARTNTGKSWVCTKMMESAQANGFPVLYYSPEMQASFLGTRFDTWRAHFQNNQLFQGHYSDQYKAYIRELVNEETSAYIVEDKDMESGSVNVRNLESMVKRYGIKLLIIDGLSYMEDIHRSDSDYIKYKNLCTDLFRLSKRYGCAVVVAMQANRESRETKDEKGDVFPNLYHLEGSDHPARICTQAFALRQIFDKNVLDIRLEKSRNAANQKPVLSYAWDVNTGNLQYLPGEVNEKIDSVISPIQPAITTHIDGSDNSIIEDDSFDEDVEF